MDTGGSSQGSTAGSGADSGGQVGNQLTTSTSTSTQQQQPTSQSQTTASSINTPDSGSSRPPGPNKGVIIGGVIGGVGAALLLAILLWYLLTRRRDKKRRLAESATYANVDNSMTEVPFSHQNQSGERQNLVHPQPAFTRSAATPHGVYMRGGETQDEAEASRLYFLPTYAESQAGVWQGARSVEMLPTSNTGSEQDSIVHAGVSPITPADGISPQTTTGTAAFMWPRHTVDTMGFPTNTDSLLVPDGAAPFLRPQHTADTMGFPIDRSDMEYSRLPTPASILAPIPRPLMVHQDSLERMIRERMMSETPEMQDVNLHAPSRGPVGAVLSQHLRNESESPVLGRIPGQLSGGPPNNSLTSSLQRSESQSTSVISAISDSELDRVGVGARSRWI